MSPDQFTFCAMRLTSRTQVTIPDIRLPDTSRPRFHSNTGLARWMGRTRVDLDGVCADLYGTRVQHVDERSHSARSRDSPAFSTSCWSTAHTSSSPGSGKSVEDRNRSELHIGRRPFRLFSPTRALILDLPSHTDPIACWHPVSPVTHALFAASVCPNWPHRTPSILPTCWIS